MSEPTDADIERAKQLWRDMHGAYTWADFIELLARRFASVRSEHDVAALMGDPRWCGFWRLCHEREGPTYVVYSLLDYQLIAKGRTPVEACKNALATVGEP